jgi:capsular exopolysaccharide synthesis family protein
MSRLFEALQRSEPDGVGVNFAQPEALVNELLKTTELEAAETQGEPGVHDFAKFPSLPISLPPDSRLVSLASEGSLGAETFRFLAVRLRQIRRARELKKLLITSTIPGEGKSTVAANLAITLAQRRQQRVLLVDGDMRRPALASELGVTARPGLTECLRAESGAVTSIYHLESAGFWFLPAGQPPDNPLDLMQTPRLAELFDRLTVWFDWIVIDSPPILPLADTSVWTRLADGVLVVAREGTTQKRQLKRGLEALDQSKLLGMVFNSCTNADHKSYYQRYGRAALPTRKSDTPSPLDLSNKLFL